LIWHYRLQV